MVSAHALHTGGGLILLRALLAASEPNLRQAFVDSRAYDALRAAFPAASLVPVQPSLLARLGTLRSVHRVAQAGDCLLCFNNAPPLARSKAHTIVHVGSHFVWSDEPQLAWSMRDRTRIALERLVFRLGRSNADEFWVQTPGMARGMARVVGGRPIRVVPMFDLPVEVEIDAGRAGQASAAVARHHEPVRLFYPAIATPHKNHINLYRAARLLIVGGQPVHLTVTLDDAHHRAFLAAAGITGAQAKYIHNIGEVSREQILAVLRESDALIFPSLAESFGIPLLESMHAGRPILAPERDYVRDVCVPAQTFDPVSPQSIADAVRRFINVPRTPTAPLSAQAFVARLLA